jgi:hypothetical protein
MIGQAEGVELGHRWGVSLAGGYEDMPSRSK